MTMSAAGHFQLFIAIVLSRDQLMLEEGKRVQECAVMVTFGTVA